MKRKCPSFQIDSDEENNDFISLLPLDVLRLIIPLIPLHNVMRLALTSTSFHHTITVDCGITTLVRFLQNRFVPSLYNPSLYKKGPFTSACEHANWEVIRIFLAMGVLPDDPHAFRLISTTWKKLRREYPLCVSSKNGHLDVVKFLLDSGADPVTHSNYAIQYASAGGHVEIVKLLLAHRANPAAHHNYAIRHACQNGHVEVAKLLLAHRVDPTTHDNYALLNACENGRVEVVKLLLSFEGVDPSADDSYAICHSSKNGHVEVVKLLLAHGVDPTALDNYAILAASKHGHVDVVHVLLAHGVDVSDRLGRVALERASANGHWEVVRKLLEFGAEFGDVVTHTMYHAIYNGQLEIVKIMLACNPPIDEYDLEKLLSCARGQLEMVQLLLDYRTGIQNFYLLEK